ncbi:MAG: SelB C-terminal domain-containing protein [Acidimicrobiia bacterium]
MRIVATAGHVDHGKSALVRTLTGMEPDRLAEERRRGLTVDLGFVWTELPTAGYVAFVDVPGHVDFVRNMLAGLAVVQSCLLVVDAREGWRPQTEEHLRFLELAGITHGLTVITKRSLVDHAQYRDVAAEVRLRLAGSFLQDKPVIACDAFTNLGIDQLRAQLDIELAALPPAADKGRPRLWIDRAFTIDGIGAVITGGVAHGSVQIGDRLTIICARRSHEIRVRGLEALGSRRSALGPGSRAAVNVAGVAAQEISRGDALIRAGDWHLAQMIDVSLEVLDNLEHRVTNRGAYLMYVGTSELLVQVRLLGAREFTPGSHGLARLRLPRKLPLIPGDRYVLRDSGRAETIGGGEVLDVAPVSPISRAAPTRSVERVVREHGWIEAAELERLTGVAVPPTLGPWVASPAAVEARRAALLLRLEHGPPGLDVASLDEQDLAILDRCCEDGVTEVRSGIAMLVGRMAELADHPYLRALDAKAFCPPSPMEFGVEPTELAFLVRVGLVVSEGDSYFSRAAVERAGRIVAELQSAAPSGVTVAEVRTALGTTRRYALPLLACLDAMGLTKRVGDRRVAADRSKGIVT